MNSDKNVQKILMVIRDCIVEKWFSDWVVLGKLTNGLDIFENHLRLYRSQAFHDEDFAPNVLEVIHDVVERDPANLQIIIDVIGLEAWLSENDPNRFQQLFGPQNLLVGDVLHFSDLFDLQRFVERIQASVDTDPELAVGSTKEMLESLLKQILVTKGESVGKEDMPDILKRVQKLLRLDPNEVDESAKGADVIKRTLSNLWQAVQGINQLRNDYGTGHGRTGPSGITSRHARLVVNAGSTLAIFLMETFEYHQSKEQS